MVHVDPEKVKQTLLKKANISMTASVVFGAFTPLCACGTMAVILGMLTTAMPWGPIMALFSGQNLFSVPLAALTGLPLYVNGEFALPLIKALMAGGAGSGAMLAFMITGPGTSAGVITGIATIIGSSTYYGSMAAEIKKLFDDSLKYHGRLDGKIGAAFTSSGQIGGGNETTILDILKAMLIHGMIVQGDWQQDHYGPVAIGVPDERAAKECLRTGQRIARLLKKLKNPPAK
jgi:hypothetical protein